MKNESNGIEDAKIPDIKELFIGSVWLNKIVDSFFSLVPQPESWSEIEETKRTGQLNRQNYPLKEIINIQNIKNRNAFILLDLWEIFNDKVNYITSLSESKRKGNIYIDENSFSLIVKNIQIARDQYCNGFRQGYFEFDNQISFPLNDTENRVRIIYECAVRNKSYFIINFYKHLSHIDSSSFKFIEPGIEAGKFYRAWYIILSNYTLFEPLFERQKTTKTNSLSNRAIVLICMCKDIEIKKQEDMGLAKMFDFKGNWEGLYQDFNGWRNEGIKKVCNIAKGRNKLLESIRNFLSMDHTALEKFETEINKTN